MVMAVGINVKGVAPSPTICRASSKRLEMSKLSTLRREKDCDRLGKLGLVASTNAGGAGKWRDELTPYFHNADVIVVADNDPQSRDKSGNLMFHDDGRPKFPGQDHAADVAAKLARSPNEPSTRSRQGVAAMPAKGDISDWFDAHSVDELNAIVVHLPDWQSRPSKSSATRDSIAHGTSWTLLRHGDAATHVPRQWVIEGLLPQTGVGLVSGQWGTFKTFNAFDLAAAVMTNGEFIRFPVRRPGGVFLLANEGQVEIDTRISAAWLARGGTGRAPFIWVPKTPRLLDDHATEILTAMIRHAEATLEREAGVPLTLVLIDALGKAAGFNRPGDENDAAVVKRVMRVLSDASLETGVLILGLTHFGKAIETGTRGSSAYEDDADVVLALIGERQVGGAINNTRLCIRKSRSGQAGDEFPFRTRGVLVGSENTLVIDWGAVEPGGAAKSKAAGWEKKSLRLLRQVLINTLVEAGKEITPWADGPIVRAVDIEVVRPQFYKGYPAAEATDANAKQAARQKAFKRAINEAKASNLIGSSEIEAVIYIWLVVPVEASSSQD